MASEFKLDDHYALYSASGVCRTCETDGERNTNVVGFCVDCDQHFCQYCWLYHWKIRELLTHETITVKDIRKKQEEMKKKDDFYVPPSIALPQCSEHQGELMEYFCNDCSNPGCCVCVSKSHRNCDILYFPDICRYVPRKNAFGSFDFDFTTFWKGFFVIGNSIEHLESKHKENIRQIDQTVTETVSMMKTFLEDADTVSLVFGEVLGASADATRDAEKEHYGKIAKGALDALTDIKTLKSGIKKSTSQLQNYRILRLMNGVNKLLESLSIKSKLGKKKGSKENFAFDMQWIETFIQSLHKLKPDKEYGAMDLTKVTDMNLNSPKDAKECQIGGAIVTGTRLIVADRGNKKVKVFDTDNEEPIAETMIPALFRESETKIICPV